MGGVEAHLTIIPIVGMAGGTQHTSRHGSGDFFIVASQEKGIRPSSHLFRFFDEEPYRMFLRPGDKKAEAVEQTADSNPHSFRWNIVQGHVLDELSGGDCGFQAIVDGRKWILVWHSDLIS